MSADEQPKINLDAALATVEGDVEILKSVVEAFVGETPRLLEDLDKAIEAQDARTARRAAHTIKGSYRILQQPQLVETWDALEKLALEDQFDRLADQLPPARQQTIAVIEQMTGFLNI